MFSPEFCDFLQRAILLKQASGTGTVLSIFRIFSACNFIENEAIALMFSKKF